MYVHIHFLYKFQYGINVCEGSEPIGVECREVVSGNPVSSLSGTTCTIEGLQCNGFTPCPNYEVRYKCGVHRGKHIEWIRC